MSAQIAGMSTTTLLVAGGAAYFVLKGKGKKALGGKSIQKFFEKSKPVGKIAAGVGAGTLINIVDKKLLGGKLTSFGVKLPFNINGSPVNLNVTDALTGMATYGLSLDKKGVMNAGVAIAGKKVAENYNYIDPPGLPGPGSIPSYSNFSGFRGFGSSTQNSGLATTGVSRTP